MREVTLTRFSNVRSPTWRARRHQSAVPTVVLGAIAILGGCGRDEIQRYQVKRPEASQPAAKAPQRLLGAIVPHGDRTWFFKLTGPPQVIAAEKERFDRFLQTVRFSEDAGEPITWTPPEGWHQHPGGELRYATFHIGEDDHSVELSVTQFPGASGGVLANVNRWRGQLGLRVVSETELPDVTTEVEIEGATATIVDFEGTSGEGGGMAAPFAGLGRSAPSEGNPPAPQAPAPLSYTTPEGWVDDSDGRGGFRAATLRVSAGGQQAEITAIPLGARSGSLLDNVNRWRGQIGLRPIEQGALGELTKPIRIGGVEAERVALFGPESAGEDRKGILAAILAHGGRTWYFKMIGPAELVASQQAAFEEFLRSVRFDEANREGVGDG